MASRLYEAYVDKVDAAGAISSYLDDPHKRKVQFVCEQPGWAPHYGRAAVRARLERIDVAGLSVVREADEA